MVRFLRLAATAAVAFGFSVAGSAQIDARKQLAFDVIEGNGALSEKGTILVDGRQVAGRNVVLAPGSYARSLPGLDRRNRLGRHVEDRDVAARH